MANGGGSVPTTAPCLSKQCGIADFNAFCAEASGNPVGNGSSDEGGQQQQQQQEEDEDEEEEEGRRRGATATASGSASCRS